MRLKRAHWAVDRTSEPQLSSWSCELDSGHPLHGSIHGGCFERSRRFLGSHDLRFSVQIRATFARSPLIGASKAGVGEEVVAFYDEEFARSTFSGQRRALNPRVWSSWSHDAMNFSDAVSLQGGHDFLVGNAYPGFLAYSPDRF
jgi:hypothetical protein